VADPYPAKPQAALSLLGAIIVRNRALFCQNICLSAYAADQFSWLESYTVTAQSPKTPDVSAIVFKHLQESRCIFRSKSPQS
jgi:hypothetical protein